MWRKRRLRKWVFEDVKADVQAHVEMGVEVAPNDIEEATSKKADEDAAAIKAREDAEEADVEAAEVADRKAAEPPWPTKKMLPLRDINRSGSFPLVNWLLIAANSAAFLFQLWLPPGCKTS